MEIDVTVNDPVASTSTSLSMEGCSNLETPKSKYYLNWFTFIIIIVKNYKLNTKKVFQ